jgi:gluconolactonase
VTPEVTDLEGPNGLAFSPDERYLYVGNWADDNKVVVRYPVLATARWGRRAVLIDMTKPGEDAIDGIKVDTARATSTLRAGRRSGC